MTRVRRGWFAFSAMSRGAAVLAVVFGMLCSCASKGRSLQELEYDPRLLTGETVFGSPVTLSEAPPFDMLETDEAMRGFAREYVGEVKLTRARFERLLEGLTREGYFDGTYIYDAGRTLTASETFRKKAGNCLSYTTMLIALAREVGLTASYQVVDVPANWNAEGGYLIRYKHVNAVINGGRTNQPYFEEFTVDFNAVEPAPEYSRSRISDQAAMALFYANRSVEQVVAGQPRAGFALLRRALELMPENVDLWLNLGAFYAKQQQPGMAIRAHLVGLELDPTNRGVMSGLARGYARLGDTEQAEYYADQVRDYRRKNAFFHFALAQNQYERAQYESSLQSIVTAIDLKRRNPRFHFMKGLVEQKLGNDEAASKSFRRAEKLGKSDDLKARYTRDLADVPTTQSEK